MAHVLLVDSSPRTRVTMIAALAADHRVMVVEDATDPLRAIRRGAFDAVLISLSVRPLLGLALVRAIRTDAPSHSVRTPKIGVYLRVGDAVAPEEAIDTWGADGWLGDPLDAAEFVTRLSFGPWPVRVGAFAPRIPARILHRLRGILH